MSESEDDLFDSAPIREDQRTSQISRWLPCYCVPNPYRWVIRWNFCLTAGDYASKIFAPAVFMIQKRVKTRFLVSKFPSIRQREGLKKKLGVKEMKFLRLIWSNPSGKSKIQVD